MDVDPDGRSIWVAARCGANDCAGSTLPPILKFDAGGTLVRAFGAGLLLSPHGIHVDRAGNVRVTDCACTGGGRGRAAGAREPDYFWQPNDVLVASDGSMFVSEGHSSQPGSAARVLEFSREGTLLETWGSFGSGPDDLDQPHALAEVGQRALKRYEKRR